MTTTNRIDPFRPGRLPGLGGRLVRSAPFAPGALLLAWALVRAAG